MSHFSVLAVVPDEVMKQGDQAARGFIEENLETYYEGLEVERYETDCFCANDKPAPDCEECKGTGKAMSTFNPESQFDWYRVGGRWDGFITENRQCSDNGFNFDPKHETIENNHLTVEAYLKKLESDPRKTAFVVLSNKGEWFEKGQMGWWGIVANEKEDVSWVQEIKTLLGNEAAEDYLVLLDCHI